MKIKKIIYLIKFDHADQSTTRKFGGTGLGLAICKQLSNLMGGKIGVRDNAVEGSTFWFTMQLEPNTDEAAVINRADNINIDNLRILVVDDSEIARTIIKEQIVLNNVEVETASDAFEALDILRNKEIDVVVTDQSMPEKSGEELGIEIRKNPNWDNISLIMVTSEPAKGDGKRLKNLGFNGYINKPVLPSEIIEVIEIVNNENKDSNESNLITLSYCKRIKNI